MDARPGTETDTFPRPYRGAQALANISAAGVARIVPRALTPILTFAAVHVLLPSQYGKFVGAAAFSAVLTQFMDGGLNQLIIRDVAMKRYPPSFYAVAGSVWKLLLLLPVLVLVWLGMLVLNYDIETQTLVWITAAGMALGSFGNIFDAVLQGHQRMFVSAVGTVSLTVTTIVVGCLALWSGAGAEGLAWAVALGYIAYGLVCVVATVRTSSLSGGMPNRSFVTYFIRQAIGFSGLQIIGPIYSRGDTVVLSRLAGSAAVGLYGLAYSTMLLAFLPAEAVATGLYPYLSAQHGRDHSLKGLEGLYRHLSLLGLPVGLGLMVYGPYLVDLLFPRTYHATGVACQVLGVAVAMMYANRAQEVVFKVRGMLRQLLWLSIAVTVSNLLSNFLLDPPSGAGLGMLGAALSMVISELLYMIGGMAILGADTWSQTLRPALTAILLLIGIGGALLLTPLHQGLIPLLPVAAGLYILGAILLGVYDKGELALARDSIAGFARTRRPKRVA